MRGGFKFCAADLSDLRSVAFPRKLHFLVTTCISSSNERS